MTSVDRVVESLEIGIFMEIFVAVYIIVKDGALNNNIRELELLDAVKCWAEKQCSQRNGN